MVIIKNFDIPKACRDCPFALGEHLYTSWEKGYCGLGKGAFNEHSDTQRLESCPMTEVVQCKDCKFARICLDTNSLYQSAKLKHVYKCMCHKTEECHDADWSCSDGKRR